MKTKVLMFLMMMFVLMGCGSSGSKVSEVKDDKKDDGSTITNVERPDTNTTSPKKTMLNALYILDAKGIEGVSYSCEDNTTGVTSKDGNFSYVKDASKICIFRINDIPLTAVDTSNITTGVAAIVSPDQNSTRVLKSLDDDKDASNGIKVLPEVVTALKGKLKRVPDTDAELVAMVRYLDSVPNYHGRAFTETPVSVKIIGFKADKKYLYNENISLEGNVVGIDPNNLTYAWKIDTDTYNTPKLLIKNFGVGSHTINLTVTDTVNNIIGSDSIKIIVSDYLVNIIKPSKKVYKKDENVILEANVTELANPTYTWTDKYTAWKDNNLQAEGSLVAPDDLSSISTKKLTYKFGIGHHIVTLKVGTKSDTFAFDVIDDSDFNLTTLTSNHDEVIVQKSTNLMWVNEYNISKGKCHKIHGGDGNKTLFAQDFTAAKTFCKDLDFGGFPKDSWRIPTKDELKTFITTTIAANIPIAYDAQCARLLATNGGNLDENSSYVTVTTRYVNTHQAGVISADGNLTPSIGLRCVKD